MDNPGQALNMQGMTQDADIIIVGGGLNGPALALALPGFRVTVIDSLPADARTDPGFDGRSYALALTSVRMLGALGLWVGLAADAQPILQITVTDGRAGEGASPWLLHFDAAEIEEGPVGHMVEDRHLRPALLAAMAGRGITHLAGETVVGQQVTAQGVTVTLGSGRSLRGGMLVGADGRGSGVASRAGIRRTRWDYDQTALVCAIAHDLPHHGVAHQFFMPAGPLAILPLTGNRCSVVWTEGRGRAADIGAMDDAGFLEALRPAFGSFLGDIGLIGARFSYPLSLSLAQQIIAPRLALVGDAAHGVHPIAGQGLNAGLRDVAALAQVLTDARRRGEDVGAAQVLARYQQWRRFDTAALGLATDGFNRLFSNDNPLLRVARDLGIGVVNAVPALRRMAMREAAGLTGDLPALMRG